MDQYGIYDLSPYSQSNTQQQQQQQQYHNLYCSCPHCSAQQQEIAFSQPSQPLPYSQIMHDSRPSSSGHDEKPDPQSLAAASSSHPQIPQPPPPTYQFPYTGVSSNPAYPTTWQMMDQAYGGQQQQQQQQTLQHQHDLSDHYQPLYQVPIPQTHFGYMPITQQQFESAHIPVSLAPATMGYGQIMPAPSSENTLQVNPLAHFQNDLNTGLSGYPTEHQHEMHNVHNIQYGALGTSPPETVDDDHSATSSEWGWQLVDNSPTRTSFESFSNVSPEFAHLPNPATAVSNPGFTLHIRSESDSSQDDAPLSATSLDSFEHIQFPIDSPLSRTIEPAAPVDTFDHNSPTSSCEPRTSSSSSSSSSSSPTQARVSPASSSSHSSPKARQKRNSCRSTRAIAKKQPPVIGPKTAEASVEKKVGRRKGPLRPEQRKQAGEIRKLRACLRCKFLKKTCDKGETCAGCQPSHARLWQVPCTRIDIKDLGFFINGWDADFARHKSLQFSPDAILEINPSLDNSTKRSLWISHGYGYCFSVNIREIFFRDNRCSIVNWEEDAYPEPDRFSVSTATLAPTQDGINQGALGGYLEAHISDKFPGFVTSHFSGTKFLSEMLITSYKYWKKTQNPTVKKALKLVVAYNLTTSGTWMEALKESDGIYEGKVTSPSSRYFGKQRAPILIQHAVSAAMGQMWRELQKDVLEELSALFQSVYTGDKLKNWPTIFIVATLLLAVWEEMQFDAQKRETDDAVVEKFLSDMEKTPVGVITGLFAAISQKVPAFSEWDTNEHKHVLASDEAACNAMTEVRAHVRKYDSYLQSRSDCRFDGDDFDCLSSKFLSKLVIKP